MAVKMDKPQANYLLEALQALSEALAAINQISKNGRELYEVINHTQTTLRGDIGKAGTGDQVELSNSTAAGIKAINGKSDIKRPAAINGIRKAVLDKNVPLLTQLNAVQGLGSALTADETTALNGMRLKSAETDTVPKKKDAGAEKPLNVFERGMDEAVAQGRNHTPGLVQDRRYHIPQWITRGRTGQPHIDRVMHNDEIKHSLQVLQAANEALHDGRMISPVQIIDAHKEFKTALAAHKFDGKDALLKDMQSGVLVLLGNAEKIIVLEVEKRNETLGEVEGLLVTVEAALSTLATSQNLTRDELANGSLNDLQRFTVQYGDDLARIRNNKEVLDQQYEVAKRDATDAYGEAAAHFADIVHVPDKTAPDALRRIGFIDRIASSDIVTRITGNYGQSSDVTQAVNRIYQRINDTIDTYNNDFRALQQECATNPDGVDEARFTALRENAGRVLQQLEHLENLEPKQYEAAVAQIRNSLNILQPVHDAYAAKEAVDARYAVALADITYDYQQVTKGFLTQTRELAALEGVDKGAIQQAGNHLSMRVSEQNIQDKVAQQDIVYVTGKKSADALDSLTEAVGKRCKQPVGRLVSEALQDMEIIPPDRVTLNPDAIQKIHDMAGVAGVTRLAFVAKVQAINERIADVRGGKYNSDELEQLGTLIDSALVTAGEIRFGFIRNRDGQDARSEAVANLEEIKGQVEALHRQAEARETNIGNRNFSDYDSNIIQLSAAEIDRAFETGRVA
ncbi:hypothetical protein GC177_10305 [bacterium]|nr:hypothetical protein [bacterium]